MSHPLLKVVVLLSGNGSNLQALIDYQSQPDCQYKIVKVIANKPEAYGLVRAKQSQIPAVLIDHTHYQRREDFEQALINEIDQEPPGLVVLAGFMRILTPLFTEHYIGKMLNIHPSLLPKYPGLNTHQRALDAGDRLHGLSIHFVTSELDGGPVILQATLSIQPGLNADSLQKKVHQLEHQAYPLAVQYYAQGQFELKNNQAWYKNQPLMTPLQLSER
ncbi:phosphoribosylglycinamide formyltransferase [Thiomicrospira microaerophila]|uniref:phosphoribosylglycinamide formyltransferase n=1 Tax=Thiomicrospira microaerophila TaxID=406020 RepID=UPI00200D8D0A|nr:phosphoribosylglycinamide formyltransferase [Thiomicrospira microaerophila]UQB43020.1 phosphoribosylglycinamide formyltransferase [Thiomicrospira microaerophila]